MTVTRFGPQNGNAATALPAGVTTNRYGLQTQTWVKDCSGPGMNDGTILDAAFFNRLIGNLEYLIEMSGITAAQGDFTAVYRAILQIIEMNSVQPGPGITLNGNSVVNQLFNGTLPVLIA
jgi:hypothetical protein